MPRNQIIGRVEKLEQNRPLLSYRGVDRFIWNGPEDDAALAEAEQAAEASGRLLILRTIVDHPTTKSPGMQAKIKNPSPSDSQPEALHATLHIQIIERCNAANVNSHSDANRF